MTKSKKTYDIRCDLTARKSVTEGSRRLSGQQQVGLKPDSENTGGGQAPSPIGIQLGIYLRYPKSSRGLLTPAPAGEAGATAARRARCPLPTPGKPPREGRSQLSRTRGRAHEAPPPPAGGAAAQAQVQSHGL